MPAFLFPRGNDDKVRALQPLRAVVPLLAEKDLSSDKDEG
jgi:hypothetical protein